MNIARMSCQLVLSLAAGDGQAGPGSARRRGARLIAAHITFIYPNQIPGARAYC
jgi:hypothetical protein